MALNRRERLSILERDNGECQGCRIAREICPRLTPEANPNKLQVHHILPRGYAQRVGFDPDYPENLITVCTTLHTGHPTRSIHPDTFQAKETYRGQTKPRKSSFQEMKERREQLIAERQTYWNTEWDRPLSAQAVKNTQTERKKGWEWVRDRVNRLVNGE